MKPIEQVYLKAKRLRIPVAIHFDLTYRCHQRCLHCYLPETWRRGEGPVQELGTNEVIGILEQLAAAGTFFLTFSGGEILLRDDLFTILEHARRLNFSTSLMSSGTLGLDEAKVGRLKDLGIGEMLFSLYSAEAAVHDRVTGNPGSFARLCGTVEACRSRGIYVVFNCLAMGLNYKEFMALKEFGDRYESNVRLDDHLAPRWDRRPHHPDLPLTDEAREELDQVRRNVEPRRAEPLTVPQDFEDEDESCSAAFCMAYISPQGEVWPCLEIPWTCGNLTREKFLDIWNDSAELNRVRQVVISEYSGEELVCHYLRRTGAIPKTS